MVSGKCACGQRSAWPWRSRADMERRDAHDRRHADQRKLWLKEQELAPDAANAILRLLDLHMNELAAGGSPLVVDVRREKVHRKTRRPMKLGFDHWMESEARGLAELWEKLTAA
jgi:hypothetical protein